MTKYTEEFEAFWKAWPGRWDSINQKTEKVGKHEAFVIWRTMAEDDKGKSLKLIKSGRVKSARFLPDCWRWLAKRRWEDYV